MLNNTTGYDFFFASLSDREILFAFPITPPELNIKMGATNETVNLINDGNINILKSIDLTEIEFEATFPMRKYPYSREVYPFKEYFDILKDFLVNKKPFRFIVSRSPKHLVKAEDLPPGTATTYNASNLVNPFFNPSDTLLKMMGVTRENFMRGSQGYGSQNPFDKDPSIDWGLPPSWTTSSSITSTSYEDIRSGDSVVVNGYLGFWDTNLPVSLESMEIKENADDGDDVVIEFKLKQYKSYGVKFLRTSNTASTSSTATTKQTLANSATSGKSDKESTSTASKARAETKDTNKDKTYTIVAGDTLTIIAKKFYDDGNKWKVIYDKNKDIIEKTAKDMGKKSSQGGNYIWAGVTLVIPALK